MPVSSKLHSLISHTPLYSSDIFASRKYGKSEELKKAPDPLAIHNLLHSSLLHVSYMCRHCVVKQDILRVL